MKERKHGRASARVGTVLRALLLQVRASLCYGEGREA